MEKRIYNLGYLKKRIRLALGVSGEDDTVVADNAREGVVNEGLASAVFSAFTELNVNGELKCQVPFIDDDTSDDLELELKDVAFEALVCLAASKLCTESEASLYTRLLYKYRDLCEGLFGKTPDAGTRNGFFAVSGRKGKLI